MSIYNLKIVLLITVFLNVFDPGTNLTNELHKKWNASTFSLIREQIRTCSDARKKDMLNGRLKILEIEPPNDTADYDNFQSLRYKLLNAVSRYVDLKQKYYIIEANDSGEKLKIRSFLITNNERKAHIFKFIYNRKWEMVKETLVPKIRLNSLFTTDACKWDNNNSEVFISEFDNLKVKSRYFLPYTLTNKELLNIINTM